MKIAVLVKQVPDTWGERRLDPSSGLLDRGASDAIIDEINERAIEVALSHKDRDKKTEVVLISMGPVRVVESLRKGLSMGADSAIHIVDDALVGTDAAGTARVLAAAIARGDFDLVVAGNESTDGRGGVVPSMVAEILGQPHLGSLDSFTISGSAVEGSTATDYSRLQVTAELPAVISVTEQNPEGRFPNFKGIMTAKRKPIETVSLSDLQSPIFGAVSSVLSVTSRPQREAGTKLVDDGSAARQLVDYLAANRLI